MTRSTEDRIESAILAERAACAAIADAYADENMAMAQDTILLDPVMSGRDRSEAGFSKAKDLMIEGCVHSSMHHAARNIAEAIRKRSGVSALAILLLATQAQASDIHVPAGMLLCPTLADALAPTHAGCWFARGGQRVERINPMPTVSQMVVRSSDGSETMVVYGLRNAADQIQRSGR